MGEAVDVRYATTLPVSVHAAYAWLTDYRDDDPDRAGAIVEKRHVVARKDNVVILEGTNVTLGTRATGQAEVTLFPDESRWECRIVKGPSKGSLYTYRLVPAGEGRARFEVVYHIRVRRPGRRFVIRLLKPFIAREIRQMWKGYEAALARDLVPG